MVHFKSTTHLNGLSGEVWGLPRLRSIYGPQTDGGGGGYTWPDADLCYGGGDSSGADVSENKTLQTEIEMPLEEGR